MVVGLVCLVVVVSAAAVVVGCGGCCSCELVAGVVLVGVVVVGCLCRCFCRGRCGDVAGFEIAPELFVAGGRPPWGCTVRVVVVV